MWNILICVTIRKLVQLLQHVKNNCEIYAIYYMGQIVRWAASDLRRKRSAWNQTLPGSQYGRIFMAPKIFMGGTIQFDDIDQVVNIIFWSCNSFWVFNALMHWCVISSNWHKKHLDSIKYLFSLCEWTCKVVCHMLQNWKYLRPFMSVGHRTLGTCSLQRPSLRLAATVIAGYHLFQFNSTLYKQATSSRLCSVL